MTYRKLAKDFGKKEFLLNYANRRWGLTKTSKVGEVMALIRECQPKDLHEWEEFYFTHAQTRTKEPIAVTREILTELGERLYEKIVNFVIPDIREAARSLTRDDCIDYVYQVTLLRTFDGFQTEKSVIYDNLSKKFPEVSFEESNPELDHAGDVDFIGKVGNKAFGIQIKPITAHANLGNYDVSARMAQNFKLFEQQFGGKVFIIFSTDDKVRNEDVYDKLLTEINRLQSL